MPREVGSVLQIGLRSCLLVISFLEQVNDIVVDITLSTVDITVPVVDPDGAAVQIMDCSSLPVQAEVQAGSPCFLGFKKIRASQCNHKLYCYDTRYELGMQRRLCAAVIKLVSGCFSPVGTLLL